MKTHDAPFGGYIIKDPKVITYLCQACLLARTRVSYSLKSIWAQGIIIVLELKDNRVFVTLYVKNRFAL